MNNIALKQCFEKMNKEASWCPICARRNNCKIKEKVAMEERLVSPYPLKHLKVTVMCEKYIKDINLPPDNENYLRSMFIH